MAHDVFCCLGVLCNLHAIEHPEIAARQTNPEAYLDNQHNLPIEVMKWAGLKTSTYRNIEEGTRGLADDNDSGKNFQEIASIIDKHF